MSCLSSLNGFLENCRFVGCYFPDLFGIARTILVQLPSSFFSIRWVSVQVVHPYSNIDKTAALKKLRFILSDRSDFHMTDSLSIAVHAFVSRVLISFWVDETRFPWEALLMVAPFSRKSKVMDPFMSQKIVCITFFTDYCTLKNFFLLESQCVSHFINSFFYSGSKWHSNI